MEKTGSSTPHSSEAFDSERDRIRSPTRTSKKKVWDRRSKKDLVDRLLKKHEGLCQLKSVLQWVGLSPSSYHYQPKGGRKGKQASTTTLHQTLGEVVDSQVITQVKSYLEHPFIDYGYHNLCVLLKRDGYHINHKKLYRLLKAAGLLKNSNRIGPNRSTRKFVKFRKINATYPMEYLEMDIKMIWIPSKGKSAYLFSVIDVYSRKIVGYQFSWSIKQKEVIEVLSNIIALYELPENVIIRSDNGSQFIAQQVREYLQIVGLEQEFTHVATPEENAHVEAYHGTLRRDLLLRIEYKTFGEFERIIEEYVPFYNNERLHGRIGRIPPAQRWEEYFQEKEQTVEKAVKQTA